MPIDYKNYPSNWKAEIRPAIMQRAENRCEFCGILNYQVRRFLKNGDVETHNYFDTQNYKNATILKEHLNEFCDDGEERELALPMPIRITTFANLFVSSKVLVKPFFCQTLC